MDEPHNVPEGPAAPPAKPAKSIWESVLTTTPVVLTILATFLAGKSSSEMTWAQYHRSLASQYQSKAGDQWGFFQAKRIRGQNASLSAKGTALMKDPQPFDLQALPNAAGQTAGDLERATREVQNLLMEIKNAKAELGDEPGQRLQAQAEALLATTKETAKNTATIQKEINGALEPRSAGNAGEASNSAELVEAFRYLNPSRETEFTQPGGKRNVFWGLPPIEPLVLSDDTIEAAVNGVERHIPDAEMAPLVLGIDEPKLQKAIADAEANIHAFDDATDTVKKPLRTISKWVNQLIELSRSFTRPADRLLTALDDAQDADNPKLAELHRAARRVARRADALRTTADRLNTDFASAELAYTDRRYEREASYNHDAAVLYEVQKHRSSAQSDRYVDRSRFFFYGMLAAQVGVTISTLALAVRQKSILWGLATVAGVVAVLVGGYLLLNPA
jgi:hypothetical protein